MRARGNGGTLRAALCAGLMLVAARAAGQQFGHKVLGTLGLDAGVQPEAGIRVAGRFVWFYSDQLMDRRGGRLPLSIDLDAFNVSLGAAGTWHVKPIHTWVNSSLAVPITRVRANSNRPEASIDKFGLGDLYAQPVRLGWRTANIDVVTGYAFYAPTGRFEPGGTDGVGQGQWSHEFSLGGALWLEERAAVITALASYELNEKKRDIDLTRGDTIQIQGGAGRRLGRMFQAGVIGYALWQVRDDRGAALPAVLRGAHDFAVGAGGEVDLDLPSVRSRIVVRYSQDVEARSRPLGRTLLVAMQGVAWQPRKQPSTRNASP